MTLPARALAAGFFALVVLAGSELGAQSPRVTAALIDSTGRRVGEVSASEDTRGALLQVYARGLQPGLHGMHLHASPRCEPPAFESAGGHLNPAQRKHGRRNPAGPHVGDLPNLSIGSDSTGRSQVRIEGYRLGSAEPSIGAPGTALVIHALPDDGWTDPAGASGARIACAIITVTTGN